MQSIRIESILGKAAAFVLLASLAACGGGGGSDSAGTVTQGSGATGSSGPPSTFTPTEDGKLHAACTNCGAVDDQTYVGSGVGLWQALNTSAHNDVVNVALKNTTGRNVTLVFTNEGTNQAMHPVTVSESVVGAANMSMMGASDLTTSGSSEPAQLKAIHQFNQNGWTSLTTRQADAAVGVAAQRNVVGAPSQNVVGVVGTTTRSFWLADGTNRATTLEATQQTSDGTTVNIWVQTSEYTAQKVTPAIVQQLMQKYAGAGGVYDVDTSIGGPFWGPNSNTGMIAPTGQPIDLVVANITPDGKPYGEVGYYYALNNFVAQASGQTYTSNQDLSLYLDSETLYLGGTAGMQAMQTTMAHESTHMQNFYRRGMLMGSQYMYETWLEETTAMMMEDWASFNLDPTYNSVRDTRFPAFMTYAGQGSYGCGLTTWDPMDTTCDSYSTNGAFGGFLNRQLGLGFYKALLNDKSSTDSMAILNDAISQFRSGSTVAQELRHFSAAAEGQIPLGANMTQYGFPAHSEGGFTLPAIDPSAVTRDLLSASPGVLLGLASFPATRSHVPSTYQETVTVPPGVTLSVVVR
ncbi:M30 family zinc metallopeptidase [Paraburkholderia sp. RL17-337-BIB-A]|uniref:M30 family zinc metallopeptidase n=1 Tax=Paraburkholderia sp. RL17-337-BIB-A TaxID=3031636 RepID=UPI0038B9C62B